jgi:hypothetical protein
MSPVDPVVEVLSCSLHVCSLLCSGGKLIECPPYLEKATKASSRPETDVCITHEPPCTPSRLVVHLHSLTITRTLRCVAWAELLPGSVQAVHVSAQRSAQVLQLCTQGYRLRPARTLPYD